MQLRYLLCCVLLLPLAACTVHVDGDRGHRHAPPQVEWRWDPGVDAYVVIGRPHLYYRDRIYYRWHDNDWHWSERHDGPWAKGYRHMPPKLHKKYGQKRHSNGGGY
jgi:hypothetical protein